MVRGNDLKPKPGTYVLLMKSMASEELTIGARGLLTINPGYYLYVGSAFGPGGIAARVGRHCRDDKKLRWHIDYLRRAVSVEAVWFRHSPKRLEHDWARSLSQAEGMETIPGFGSSDCRCPSHLFFCAYRPDPIVFARSIGEDVEISSFVR